MRNKIIYIVLSILVIVTITFGTIMFNILNRVGIIEKQSNNTEQLAENSSSNAYITTQEHLNEIAQLQRS